MWLVTTILDKLNQLKQNISDGYAFLPLSLLAPMVYQAAVEMTLKTHVQAEPDYSQKYFLSHTSLSSTLSGSI
jgi:hypothetical protein